MYYFECCFKFNFLVFKPAIIECSVNRIFLNKIILFILVHFFVSANCLFADNGPLIRIAIAKGIDRVVIKMSGSYQISDPVTRKIIEEDLGFGPTAVTGGLKGLRLGERQLSEQRIRFYAHRDVVVSVDNKERRYRGFIDVLLASNGKLLVINQLEIEDYIKGVLYHEVSNRWPMEVLKVQAVAARSYAITQIQASVKRDFDVTNDIYSQVYGGRDSERYRTNMAVDATQGEILTVGSKALPSYFHATCGGHTEDSAELWPKQTWAALKGVTCIYCRESPHYYWKRNIRLKDIQDKLNAKGYAIGLIEDIAVTKRNSSDRIVALIITDRTGKQLTISGKDFREIVGPNLIRSNNYFIIMQGYYCDFIGKGWGHGVGMCQWGAQAMASREITYDKILQHYYPGAGITRIKEFSALKVN